MWQRPTRLASSAAIVVVVGRDRYGLLDKTYLAWMLQGEDKIYFLRFDISIDWSDGIRVYSECCLTCCSIDLMI